MAQLSILLKTRYRILRNYLKCELNRTLKIELSLIIAVVLFLVLHNVSRDFNHLLSRNSLDAAFSRMAKLWLLFAGASFSLYATLFYRTLLNRQHCQLSLFLPIASKQTLHALVISTIIKSVPLIMLFVLILAIFVFDTAISVINTVSLLLFIASGFLFIWISSTLFILSAISIRILSGRRFCLSLLAGGINCVCVIFLVLKLDLFESASSTDSLHSLKGFVFLGISMLLIPLNYKLWDNFAYVWHHWLVRKQRSRFFKIQSLSQHIYLPTRIIPASIRPFVVRDLKLLFRAFKPVAGIVLIILLIVIAICRHTSDVTTLASSLAIVCILAFYILCTSYFKMIQEGHEQMRLIKSLPVSAIRYWYAKFTTALLPMLLITFITITSLVIFRGWQPDLVIKLFSGLLFIAIVFSFVQTSFMLAIFPFTDYMPILFSLYLLVLIVTFPFYTLISLVMIFGCFFLMKKALRNFNSLEF
ncbi:hypothetical protein JXJ21_02285 [candidate division KSB1 bacterium]|nr:hypothetical protein [candidate division KSB1 bacterium]